MNKIYLGTCVRKDNFLDIFPVISRKELIALGDVIYTFVSVDSDEVYKVGKADGVAKMYGRIKTYEARASKGEYLGQAQDATSRFIVERMIENDIKQFGIYLFPVPRVQDTWYCPIRESLQTLSNSQARAAEDSLTQHYLQEGHALIFSKQLKG